MFSIKVYKYDLESLLIWQKTLSWSVFEVYWEGTIYLNGYLFFDVIYKKIR